MPAMEKQRKLNSDIEILRAIAVLLTIFHHIPFFFSVKGSSLEYVYTHFSFWGGVDLFFCISGFVITQSLLRNDLENNNGRQHLLLSIKFYIRRIYRILPSSFLWLFIYLTFSNLASNLTLPDGTSLFGHPGATLQSVFAAMCSMANLTTANNNIAPTLISQYWSLSLEEQFYMIYPLALFLVPQKRLIWSIAFLVLVQFFIPRTESSILWNVRTDSIALGCLLAFLHRSSYIKFIDPKFLSSPLLRIVVPLFLIILCCFVSGNGGNVYFSTGVLAFFCAAIIFIASFDNSYILFNRHSKIKNIFVYLGQRSYAIYLSHMLSLAIAAYVYFYMLSPLEIHGARAIVACCFIFISTQVLFCELNFQLVEQPLRAYGRSLSKDFSFEEREKKNFRIFPVGYLVFVFRYFRSRSFMKLTLFIAFSLGIFLSCAPETLIWPVKPEAYIMQSDFDVLNLPPYAKNYIRTEGIGEPERLGRFFGKFVWINGPLAILHFPLQENERLDLKVAFISPIQGQSLDILFNEKLLLHIDTFVEGKRYVLPLMGVKGENTLKFIPTKWNGNGETLNALEKRPLAIMATQFVIARSQ